MRSSAVGNFYGTKVQLWANVLSNGLGSSIETQLPVTDFSSVFALNAIPTSSITLSVGYNAANPNQKAASKTIRQLTGKYVDVVCKLVGAAGKLDGKTVQWPEGRFSVFKGRISGASYSRQRGGQVSSSLAIEHWLMDLDNTNWTSALLDENSPDWLGRVAGYKQFFEQGTMIPSDVLDRTVVIPIESGKNIWVDAVKKLLLQIANNDLGTLQNAFLYTIGATQNGNSMVSNKKALSALAKMDQAAHMVIPPLDLFGADNKWAGMRNYLFKAFTGGLGKTMFSDNDRPTLWAKMMRLAQYSLLSLTPSVETATMIPFMPTINTHWLEMDSSEFDSIRTNARIPRLLRGVALITGDQSMWGVESQTQTPYIGYTGIYDLYKEHPDMQSSEGRFYVGQAPSWLRLGEFQQWGPRALVTAVDADKKREDKPSYDNIAKGVKAAATFGDAYAKSTYMNMVFGDRAAEVSGRLRFDICPGSMILIKGTHPDLDAAGYSASSNRAAVIGVTTVISSGGQCGTALRLSHLRTEDEFELSVENHPLYNSSWRGSPLVNLEGVTPEVVA
jgi:hypothetical protein